MARRRTSDIEGEALDRQVAFALGWSERRTGPSFERVSWWERNDERLAKHLAYSSDWRTVQEMLDWLGPGWVVTRTGGKLVRASCPRFSFTYGKDLPQAVARLVFEVWSLV